MIKYGAVYTTNIHAISKYAKCENQKHDKRGEGD